MKPAMQVDVASLESLSEEGSLNAATSEEVSEDVVEVPTAPSEEPEEEEEVEEETEEETEEEEDDDAEFLASEAFEKPLFNVSKIADRIKKTQDRQEPPAPVEVESKKEKSALDTSPHTYSFDTSVRSYQDIFSSFPIGDGEWYVTVDRKTPKIFQGRSIVGMQKPLREAHDFMSFAKQYGQGQYSLCVYGPTPNKRLDVEGKLLCKAYTKQIRVDVPDPHNDYPPNLDMAALSDPYAEEEDGYDREERDMRSINRRGPTTEADADIHKSTLNYESIREERMLEIEERRREREEMKARQAAEERERALQEERHRAQAEQSSAFSLFQRVMDNQASELREARNRPSNEKQTVEAIAVLAEAMKPNGPSQDQINALNERHANEVSRIRQEHADTINRVRDDHTREIDRLRNELDRQLRDSQDRNEQRYSEAIKNHESRYEELRRRSEDRVREVEERSRRDVEDAKNEATRRIQELTSQYDMRMNDLRYQSDRDVNMKGESLNMQMQTIQQGFEMRMQMKEEELNRTQVELNNIRRELENEKGKSLAERLNEFSEAAEAAGYSKGEEGQRDFKSMLGEAAIGLVGQVPQLAGSIASVMKNNNATPMQAMPQLPPQGIQRPASVNVAPPPGAYFVPPFASEDVHIDFEPPAPTFREEDPLAGIENTEAAKKQSQSSSAEQGQQNIVPAQQENSADSMITDHLILTFSGMFRQAYTDGTSPEELSAQLNKDMGEAQVQGILANLSLERVFSVLNQAPEGDSDPLLRREGQQYLQSVWKALQG